MENKRNLVLIGSISILLLCGCNPFSGCTNVDEGQDSGSNNGTIDGSPSSTVENTAEVNKMNTYIDASISMRPYFVDGHNREIVATISAIWTICNCNIYFWDSDRPFILNESTDLTKSLTDKRNFGRDSKHDVMIKKLIQMVESDSVEVACLITDGILGTNLNQTQQTPEIMKASLPVARDMIANCFSGNSNIGVSLYRFTSDFYASNSTLYYCTYSNRHIYPLEIEARPYYVLLIGRPAQLRKIKGDNYLTNYTNELHFGIHEFKAHKVIINDVKHFDTKNHNYWKGPNNEDAHLSGKLPECLIGLEEFLFQNAEVKLNGKEIDKNNLRIKNGKVELSFDIAHSAAVKKGNNKFSIEVFNNIPSEWNDLSCEDDQSIATDIALQSQTYGLFYLVQGLYIGSAERKLLDITYTFTK